MKQLESTLTVGVEQERRRQTNADAITAATAHGPSCDQLAKANGLWPAAHSARRIERVPEGHPARKDIQDQGSNG